MKLHKLKRLTKGEAEILIDRWDSDDDLADYDYQLGEKLDY